MLNQLQIEIKFQTDWIPILQNFLTPIEGNISDQCRADSLLYMSELNGFSFGASWAYKMFDASAKLLQPSLLQVYIKYRNISTFKN